MIEDTTDIEERIEAEDFEYLNEVGYDPGDSDWTADDQAAKRPKPIACEDQTSPPDWTES